MSSCKASVELHIEMLCKLCDIQLDLCFRNIMDSRPYGLSVPEEAMKERFQIKFPGCIFELLQDFIDAGVTAYAVGCTTEDLRKELLNIVASGGDLENTAVSSGSVGIKSKVTAEEVQFLTHFLGFELMVDFVSALY